MFLEKLNGKDIKKRLADPTFCDIDYVVELLRQVLMGLDRAQTQLGFKHRDMRIDNVMEHKLSHDTAQQQPGHDGDDVVDDAAAAGEEGERRSRKDDHAHVAEAEGGQQLHQAPRSSHVSHDASKDTSMEDESSRSCTGSIPHHDEHHHHHHGKNQETQDTNAGARAAATTTGPGGGGGGAKAEEDEEAEEGKFGKKVDLGGLHFKIIDYGHSVLEKSEARELRHHLHKTRNMRQQRRFRLPTMPIWSTEKLYRWLFKERGDVWRFLRSLGQALEGRTWPERDRARVRDLLSLIHQTTGVVVLANFGSSLQEGQRKASLFSRLCAFGGRLFPVRWLYLMVTAYLFPGKPTMSPREALHRLATLPSKHVAVSKTLPSFSFS